MHIGIDVRAFSLVARALLLAMLAAIMVAAPSARSAAGAESGADRKATEQELGVSIYDNLKAQRVIVESSPLYDALTPISNAIVRAAQPRYYLPMKVWLVHSGQPNAFATPGGNIFVTDELLYFVKNREELAGTLCHEVSHLIHEDSMELAEKQERLMRRELGATILLGPSAANVLAITLIGKLQSLRYSRDVESRADLTGADVCASAGYNPWGLVWLFGAFENSKSTERPEFLSDHPDNDSRIDALKQYFASNPQRFGRFSSQLNSASSIAVPEKAPEVFLR
ncbi:MAG TPA: M48 family metallopeptidase [Steroidobacteraceae bacterium]|nr:M48 family metallopeptidase [Steroidobacteraceae bacterium]